MSMTEPITTLNGKPVTVKEAEIEALAASVRGQVLLAGDAGYDAARRVWNGMIDKHPALIVRCAGTADVVTAVNFAREHELLLAVRGGGHNVAGNAVCEDGLVIDLSSMKGIYVDPVRRTARVQGGVTWGDLDHETQIFGLATPGGEVSTTGIAGYTLSGGIGMLHRKWGLACDNLLSVEIVTSNGEVLRASVTDYPDLFWAVRGGGGNFGVVTWFEYELHPLGPEVYSVVVAYALEDAPAVLRAWHAYTKQATDEVTSEALFWSVPPLPDRPAELHGRPIVVIAGLYAGPADEGESVLAPLRAFGTPIIDLSGRESYTQTQCAFDALFPAGLQYYWKSLFLDDLDEDMIETIIDLAADRPSPESLIALRHLGGAISRVPEDATAYGNRRARYNLSLDTTWEDPNESERMIAWTRRAWSELRERTGGGVYLNFAGLGEENETLARAGYGRNYEQLTEIKRRYDPTNLFRGNINIMP